MDVDEQGAEQTSDKCHDDYSCHNVSPFNVVVGKMFIGFTNIV